MTEVDQVHAQRRGLWPIAEKVLQSLGAGLVAGVVAGAVGAGAARIAMRVAALLADPCAGVITENDNPCGVFTFSGTAGLIIFGALFQGVAGGILYAAFVPWLRGLGGWRGLVFGVAILAVLGFTLFDPANPDFDRFGSPVVNVVMFAVLFPVFGLVVAPVFDVVKSRMPALPPRRQIRWTDLPGYAVMALAVFAAALAGIGSVGIGLLALAVLAMIHELGERVEAMRKQGQQTHAVTIAYLVLVIPLVAGTVNTARLVAQIIGT